MYTHLEMVLHLVQYHNDFWFRAFGPHLPDDERAMNWGLVNSQARKLSLINIAKMIEGSDKDRRRIARKLNCRELMDFIERVTDGNLHELNFRCKDS